MYKILSDLSIILRVYNQNDIFMKQKIVFLLIFALSVILTSMRRRGCDRTIIYRQSHPPAMSDESIQESRAIAVRLFVRHPDDEYSKLFFELVRKGWTVPASDADAAV